MSPRRRRAGVGLVAVLAVLAVGSFVVLVGAGGGGDDRTQRATAGAPPTAAPADPPASAPELKNTGEDW